MSKAKEKKEDFFGRKELFSEEFVWHLMLGLWMLGIFILSGIEGSGQYYYNLLVLIERKGAHVFEFLALAYLFWKILSFYSLKFRQQVWLTFLFSLLYASWDEVHQLFVFGREGRMTDIGIDLGGIVLFLGFLIFKKSYFGKKKTG